MTLSPGIRWLDELRAQGAARYKERGLPTQRAESWKYTSLSALKDFAFARANGAASIAVPRENSLSHALTTNEALVRRYLGKIADAKDDPLATLNTAAMDDGVALLLSGETRGEPLMVTHKMSASSDGLAAHPRNLIVLQKGASAVLVERFTGSGRYLTNPLTEIALEDGAKLTHIRLFDDDAAAFNLSHTRARVGRDASYTTYILATGGALVRDEIRVDLVEPGAETTLNGVYLARGQQHSDHTTVIRHSAPHTTSRELFKGALDGEARAVFQGCIYVAKGADGTDGQMTNKTLLLSDKAEIDTKPQLEIYADDVKCAHGATAGELEEDALFYMRARGIPEKQARALLIEAFLAEVVEDVPGDAGEAMRQAISAWMKEAA